MTQIIKKLFLAVLATLCFWTSEITSIDYGKIVFEDGVLVNDTATDIDEKGDIIDMSQEANQVVIKTLYDYEPFYNYKEEIDEDATYEEVEEYKTKYRARAKEYYTAKNNEYLMNQKMTDYERVYVSKYSPQIEYSYTINAYNTHKHEILTKLAKDNDVSQVYVSSAHVERVECLQAHLYFMGEQDIYKNRVYTGEGVVIGILDLGLVDTSRANFGGIDVTTLNQLGFTDLPGEHASQMACTFAGIFGIACDAKILSAQLHVTMTNEVEWMIDRNVDVINMSFGNTLADGTYGSESAFADYIVKTYDVMICASVGNNGQGNAMVSNPAMGYNVLSVGAASSSGNAMSLSNYKVAELCPPKPVVVAPGSFITVPGYDKPITGTSVATAIMTGSVALLYEKIPSYKTDADKVIAYITCCSDMNDISYEDNGFSEKEGAGMYNYLNSLDSSFKIRRYSNTSGKRGDTFYGGVANLEVGDTLKVTMASLINCTGAVGSVNYTDYDIKVLDSSGNLVAIKACGISNVEMLEYTPTVAGKYYIYLYQASERVNASDQICYAYRVFNASKFHLHG